MVEQKEDSNHPYKPKPSNEDLTFLPKWAKEYPWLEVEWVWFP